MTSEQLPLIPSHNVYCLIHNKLPLNEQFPMMKCCAEIVAQICKFCNIFSRYVKKNETHFLFPIPSFISYGPQF